MQWQERIGPDEEARHRAFAERLDEIQSEIDGEEGAGRVLHRKQVLGASARLEVLGGLPEHARQGLFATPATHEAVVRLSNGGVRSRSDLIPDIRGFALSVRGLDGHGALGGRTGRQDFVLINRSVFGPPDSRLFMAVVRATAEGVSGAAGLVKSLAAEYGARAPLEAAALTRDFLRPFSGFATEPFFSAAPLAWGPYAVKVALEPQQHDGRHTPVRDFTADLVERLAHGPLLWDLRVRFFVSEELTPIEDGSREWSAQESPLLTVGRVTIPAQDPTSPEGQALAAQLEQDRFDPWAALAEHRPLGEIMRARKVAYLPSQQHRRATGT